jgi:prolyl 4-hydroxylase
MDSQSSTQSAGEQRQQFISAELKEWIVAQAKAGVAPDTVLEAMKSSGWHEDVAIRAMEDTLQNHLAEPRGPPPGAGAGPGGGGGGAHPPADPNTNPPPRI